MSSLAGPRLMFLLACTLLFSLSSLSQMNPGTAQKLDSALTWLHHRGLFNGVILVAEKGSIIYQKSLGKQSAQSREDLDIRSSFNLASVSKQFMAALVMMLKEEGRLQFDQPVTTYLPGFPYASITIRHLLTHTSGLPEYFDLAIRYRNTMDTLNNAKLLELLREYQPALRFEPGSKWEYCNTGYIVLGALIEKVSGSAVEDYFNKRISGPLHLDHTYIHYLNMRQSHPLSASRVRGMKRSEGQYLPDDLIRVDGVIGDGNVYASAADLLKWDQALYTSPLLQPETLKEAFTPVRLNNGSTYNYGFGWFLQDSGATVYHTGSWVGFRTLISRDLAHQRTVIGLTNGNAGGALRIVTNLLNGSPVTLPRTVLIRNIRLIDGSGLPARKASVRLLDSVIYESGNLTPVAGETVIDGRGMVLAPGFIDSHSHHLSNVMQDPDALPALSQGITTIVIGQDGQSEPMDSLAYWLSRQPVGVNIASYTGHATLREQVMGAGNLLRRATAQEVSQMKTLLDRELSNGSLGLSSGLEYEEGFYSSRDEVLELAKLTATHKGTYMSHIRSEDIQQEEAVEEIIETGREAKLPVLISHIKIARKENWESSPLLLQKLQQARAAGIQISADVYPYTFWNSTLKVLFPNRDYDNLESAVRATQSLFDPSASYLVEFAPNPAYKGKTIAQIAALRKETTPQTLIGLIRMAHDFERAHPGFKGSIESIAATSMSERDIAQFISWPHANICSDGRGGGHPRGYGAFTRVLGRYVREQHVLNLETAIYKMTSLAAEHTGIPNRGLIAPGYAADLVLFDPDTVSDKATISKSSALSTGIHAVWVNGALTYQQQKPTGVRPGKLIKRPEKQ